MTVITLTKSNRDDVKSLLEDHQQVTDALSQIDKATWLPSLYLTHKNGNEDVCVSITSHIAKAVLNDQKIFIEHELSKLGIEIKP